MVWYGMVRTIWITEKILDDADDKMIALHLLPGKKTKRSETKRDTDKTRHFFELTDLVENPISLIRVRLIGRYNQMVSLPMVVDAVVWMMMSSSSLITISGHMQI